MAITIRERNLKRNSPGNPQFIEVSLDTAEGSRQRLELRLGYDAEALSWFYRFTLERPADVRVRRFSEDPYIVHLGVTISPLESRNGQILVGTADGDSGWVTLAAGTYRMVAAMTFIGVVEAVLLFEARPRRARLLSDPAIDDTADCVALLSAFTPQPMVDVRTVERFRPLALDIAIDTDQLLFDFSTWSALLIVYTDSILEPIHSQLLDGAELAAGRFVVTVVDDEVATWPDAVNAAIVGTSLYGRQLVLLEGAWSVVDPPGGPGFLAGLPAIDTSTIDRHASLGYVMGLEMSLPQVPVNLEGWEAFLDVWSADYGGRLALAQGDLSLRTGAAVFDVPPNATTGFPDLVRVRGWLVDGDGGTHWLMRGAWPVSQGVSRSGVIAVRDDRLIQAGETLHYRLRLLRGGAPLDLDGYSGVIQLSLVGGTPLAGAAGDPIPLVVEDAAGGIIAATIPSAITEALPAQVAMAVIMDTANGMSGVVLVAGVWTVSPSYTVPVP